MEVSFEDGLGRDYVDIIVKTDGGSLVTLAAEQKSISDLGVKPFLDEYKVLNSTYPNETCHEF